MLNPCLNGHSIYYLRQMELKFKIQKYQTEAVKNTTDIFIGQPNRDTLKYRRDLGKIELDTIKDMLDDEGY